MSLVSEVIASVVEAASAAGYMLKEHCADYLRIYGVEWDIDDVLGSLFDYGNIDYTYDEVISVPGTTVFRMSFAGGAASVYHSVPPGEDDDRYSTIEFRFYDAPDAETLVSSLVAIERHATVQYGASGVERYAFILPDAAIRMMAERAGRAGLATIAGVSVDAVLADFQRVLAEQAAKDAVAYVERVFRGALDVRRADAAAKARVAEAVDDGLRSLDVPVHVVVG